MIYIFLLPTKQLYTLPTHSHFQPLVQSCHDRECFAPFTNQTIPANRDRYQFFPPSPILLRVESSEFPVEI